MLQGKRNIKKNQKQLFNDWPATLPLPSSDTATSVVWGHESNFDLNITVSKPSITRIMWHFDRSGPRTNSYMVRSSEYQVYWECTSKCNSDSWKKKKKRQRLVLLQLHLHSAFHQEMYFSPSKQTFPTHNLEDSTYLCLANPWSKNQPQLVLPSPSQRLKGKCTSVRTTNWVS